MLSHPGFYRLGACSDLLQQHLGLSIVKWDQLVGAAGPQRCWWEHNQPQVQAIEGMWWENLAGRARRTWGISVSSLGVARALAV